MRTPYALLATFAILALVAAPQAASADTIYNDGAVHNVNSAVGDAYVSNSTTVNFVTGGTATGDGGGGAGVTSTSSDVGLNGGSVTGGVNANTSGFGGVGIRMTGGTLTVTGGTATGGSKGGGSGFGGTAIQMAGGTFNASGGSVIGGWKSSGSGFGGDGLRLSGTSLTISGGFFQGGDTAAHVGGDALDVTSVTGLISGGTFHAGEGSTADGNLINAHSTALDITGGSFESGYRWWLSGGSVFTVFGSGLSLSGSTLTGTLADGSLIDISYSLRDGSSIQLGAAPVPEPGSIGLLGLGLVALRARRSRRKMAA